MKAIETYEILGRRSVPHRHYGERRWEDDCFPSVSGRKAGPVSSDPDAEPPPAAGDLSLSEALRLALKRCRGISIDPEIMEGRPCVAGTRIPVRAVLRVIEQYGSIADAVKCYPHLSLDQVRESVYFSQLLLELPDGIDETSAAS
jgi:uncharacterized protein (DUF433 family)